MTTVAVPASAAHQRREHMAANPDVNTVRMSRRQTRRSNGHQQQAQRKRAAELTQQ